MPIRRFLMRRSIKRMIGLILLLMTVCVVGFVPVRADDPTPTPDPLTPVPPSYSFVMGNKEVNDGDVIDYSLYSTTDNSLSIVLRSSTGFAAGTTFSWSVSNDNIVQILSQDDANCSVKLNILSPGYSGMYVSIKDPDGTLHPAAAYCSIYVPLEWSDNVTTGNNNMFANVANGNYYGLFNAQMGDSTYTLQLYTKESKDFPNRDHYLRMLKYVTYSYTAASGKTGLVTSDVDPSELKKTSAALIWESSDTTVVEVDSLTGMIKAVNAGFARITVSTSTVNERENTHDSLSFNVLVVPEGYVENHSTDYLDRFIVTTSPTEDQIVLQTNAKYASTLKWKLYQGDAPVKANEITKKYKNNIEISESSGRVVLSGLPAGVYYLAGISEKDSTASKTLPTYEVESAIVRYLGATFIVPLKFTIDSLVLNYYNDEVFDTYDLLGTSNLPDGTFRFTSNDTNIASVGINDGIVAAKGIGECKVIVNKVSDAVIRQIFGSYAASPGAIGFDGSAINVDVKVVNGIAISSTSETMALGSTLQLYLASPNPFEGEIDWSVTKDGKVVTVDDTGLVTAVGNGDAYVIVRVKIGGVTKQAKCKIHVAAAVDSIVLTSKSDYVAVGENLTISATIAPKLAGAKLLWSVSDDKLATLADASDLSCTITGVKNGTVVVSAVNSQNSIVATKVITIVSEIAGISLNGDKEVTIPLSAGYYQLYATCSPELPENAILKWSSSDTKVVKVDERGKVTLVKPGKAIVSVVTPNGLMAQCTFTVTQGVTGIKLDETDITMYVGDKYRMTYTVQPATATNTTLKWDVLDTKVVTVDSSGYLTAKNAGSTVIIVRSMDGTGVLTMATVTVLRKATGLKVDASALTLNVNETYQLEVTMTPSDSTDTLIFESSNSKVATISKKGKITAKSKGTAVIMVKTPAGITAYCNVEVVQQVTGVTIKTKDPIIVMTGETLKLEAEVTPKTANDVTLKWETKDQKVAKVSDDGTITGVGEGVTLVTCTTNDGDYMAYAFVTVHAKVTGLKLNVADATINTGEILELDAIITPSNAFDKSVTWTTTNAAAATVDKEGRVTGVAPGTTLIKCTTKDGGYMAYCVVTVIEKITSIKIRPTAEVGVGEKLTLEATIDSERATNKEVTWDSCNEAICTVNSKGVVEGLRVGTSVITVRATDGTDAYAECEVTVIYSTKSINVSEDMQYLELIVGESKQIEYTVNPDYATYDQQFTVDDSNIAIVSKTGIITGLKPGETLVHVVAGDNPEVSDTVYLKVIAPIYANSITFSDSLLVLVPGETYTAVPSTSPAKITEGHTWTTDNAAVATVSSTGKITAKGRGVANITYLTQSGKKASIKVYVVGLSETDVTLQQYSTLNLRLEVFGAGERELTVKWGSDNPAIAEMSNRNNGSVTAKALGTTMVWADVNGRKLTCKIKVVPIK